jgi:hypothetical protein
VLDPVRNSGVWTDYLVANVVAASCIDTLLQVEATQMPELIDADVTKLAEPFWAPSSAEQSDRHTINSLFTRGEHDQSAPSSQVNTEVAADALRSIVTFIWGHEKWRIERKQFMLALLKDFAASSGTWKNLRAKTQDSPATSSVYDDRNLISEKFAEFYVTEIGAKGLLSLGYLSQLASDRVFNLTVLNKLHNNNVIDDAEYDAAKRSLHASPPQRKFSQNIVPLKQALESLQKIDGPQ